jgi:hypothetical protein
MLKFIHKKHIGKNFTNAKLVIYYNLFDIVLGFFLIILVTVRKLVDNFGFFIKINLVNS